MNVSSAALRAAVGHSERTTDNEEIDLRVCLPLLGVHLGCALVFWGVWMKPGFPLAFGRFQGERGLLKIPADWLLRMRYNPFYTFLERRSLAWVEAPRPRTEP